VCRYIIFRIRHAKPTLGVQAFKWFYITIHGRDSHAGTTPLYSRKDAMLCAAKIITTSNEVAKLHNGLATTGIISPEPGSINTIPHTVRLSLDLRHTNDEDLDEMIRECKFRFAKIAELESEMGCELEWEELVDSPAVHFDKECIAVVEESAREVCSEISGQPLDGRHYRPMISGAGHDSCYTNRRCPTSMIFTPTKDGISHNPKEYCAPEDWSVLPRMSSNHD
jgi:hydantoinase/carbamoylase family amidase